MGEIQAYMKKVTGFFCQVHEKGDILQLHKISSIFNDIRVQVFSMTSKEQISADRSVFSSSCFYRRAVHWWRRWNCCCSQVLKRFFSNYLLLILYCFSFRIFDNFFNLLSLTVQEWQTRGNAEGGRRTAWLSRKIDSFHRTRSAAQRIFFIFWKLTRLKHTFKLTRYFACSKCVVPDHIYFNTFMFNRNDITSEIGC